MSEAQTLDDMITSANKERVERKPLLNFSENVNEIREICLEAAPYVKEMNEELMEPDPWELVVQGVIFVLKETFMFLNENKSKDFKEVFIDYGTLMKVAISYAETKTAGKAGTFNPCIYVGKDLDYNTTEYNDLMTVDMKKTLEEEGIPYMHPMFFEQREQIKEICSRAARKITADFGVAMYNSESLSYFLVAFFRKAKEWLIKHEDASPVFYIGRLIKMGIEKHKDGSFFIYVSPAQQFKMEYAKGDSGKNGTETIENK